MTFLSRLGAWKEKADAAEQQRRQSDEWGEGGEESFPSRVNRALQAIRSNTTLTSQQVNDIAVFTAPLDDRLQELVRFERGRVTFQNDLIEQVAYMVEELRAYEQQVGQWLEQVHEDAQATRDILVRIEQRQCLAKPAPRRKIDESNLRPTATHRRS